jgi:hypothetical protein
MAVNYLQKAVSEYVQLFAVELPLADVEYAACALHFVIRRDASSRSLVVRGKLRSRRACRRHHPKDVPMSHPQSGVDHATLAPRSRAL